MIRLIYGKKGSGKTKEIISQANDSISTGVVVFITDTSRYMYDIKRDVRFINAADYGISSETGFLGFIRGLIAANSDIKKIYIDGAHRLANKEIKDMENFYTVLEALSESSDTDFILTVSADREELPDFIAKYIR